MLPLVSLVITTFNRKEFLARAIASVLCQSYTNFELVIWDDGSTDDSVALAESYARQDLRVQVIAAPHWGRVPALRKAIAQTKGQYLGWIDSDDWLHPHALAETVAALESQPTAGFAYTDYLEVNATGRPLGYGRRCAIPYCPERLLVDFMTFHLRLIRRSAFDQVGGIAPDSTYAEDYDLCLRLSEIAPVVHVPQPLYYYRLHANSLSAQQSKQQFAACRRAIAAALRRRGLTQHYALETNLYECRFRLRRKPVNRSTQKIAAVLTTFASSLVGLANAQPGQAQSITPGASSNTQVMPNGNQFNITGGNLSGDSKNLFHSFSQFGLSAGEIANFLATPQLQNILGGVNGGNPSVINGLIQVTGGTPNLYLMNPAGIVFGTNASLNVPAAFTATTANAIGFGNNWFSTTGTTNYANLIGSPNGFAFTRLQPGSILNAGNLAVNPGQTLTLLGGTVVNTGTLTAPSGQITLMAVPGGKLVRLTESGSLLSLDLPLETQNQLPVVTSTVAPSLPQLLTGGNLPTATGVEVNADGSISLTSSGTVIPAEAGTTIATGNISTAGQTGGKINLLGDQVGVVGAAIDASGNNGGGTVLIGGDYQGKGTVPNAKLTVVDPTSTILANGGVTGDGGRIIIWSDETTRFYGDISATGGSQSGNGGFVEVSGKKFLTFQGTTNLVATTGKPGTLLLDPSFLSIIDAPAGSGSLDGALPNLVAATPDAGANTVSWGTIGAAGANIVLEAIGDITFQPITGAAPGVTAPGAANLDLGPGGSLAVTSTSGNVSFVNLTDTIRTNGGSVSVSGANLNLGNIETQPNTFLGPGQVGSVTLTATGTVNTNNINTSAGFITPSDGGNLTINAGGSILTGDLTGNGYNAGGATQGGTVSITSTAGSITIGDIVLESFGSTNASGGNVTLETLTNGGDIAFSSIAARGTAGAGLGGSATITARGSIRGYGTSTVTGQTIAVQGTALSGDQGSVTLQHDGTATNLADFVVGGAVTSTTGNGTVGGIQVTPGATADVTPTQTLGFATSPFTAAGGNIQVTYDNSAPTLTGSGSLPSVQTGQTLTFTLADLGLAVTDANGDTNLSLQVGAIATGATLTINGSPATVGTIIPANAQFTLTPPAGFSGTLSSAFSIVANDLLQNSTPLAVPLQVTTQPTQLDLPPACVFSTCTSVTLPAPPVPPETVTLDPYPTFEERFTRQVEGYLNLPDTNIRSADEAQNVAQDIQKAIGVKPGFIYVGFVPATYPVAGEIEKTKELSTLELPERPDDQLEVVLITPTGVPVRKRIPEATREKVIPIANQFRSEVSDPRKTRSTSYLPTAQQLYQWILTPIEPDLQKRGIENLVFLLDGGLRSIPIAAFHDGKSFLIERYSVGLMPSLSLTNTLYQDIRKSQVLGMGISVSTGGQLPLPGVLAEVTTVVNRIWAGRLALNENVTPTNLQALRQQQPFGIVHLATHADFRPGSLEGSYIQFWNERVNLNQIRQLSLNNPQIELLVLSACTTALGDREAELGFSGVAVQTGVKSTIASLWYVNDASAVALVTGFYKKLLTSRIKAEALQQIQIAMAKGEVRLEGDRIVGLGIEGGVLLPPESLGIRDTQFIHPYYWAGFTLVGNPW
jgi:filamentous hemagglutinin family protein